jgi:hypothetical protein
MQRKVRSILIFITIIIIACCSFGAPALAFKKAPNLSAGGMVTILSYTGKAEISGSSTTSGSMNFDLTCEFDFVGEASSMNLSIAIDAFPTTQVKLNGSECKFKFDKGNTNVFFTKPLKTGRHKLQMVYGGKVEYGNPSNIRVQLFVNSYHFHCYNAWYPMVEGAVTASLVKFAVDVKIPGDWYMLGSFVQKEFRDKPKPDGKYRYEVEKANIYTAKLVGGDYNVFKEGNEKFGIRVYTFKNQSINTKSLVKHAINSANFYSDYFGKPCDDDFFVAAQTGRRGNGQGLDGGFVMDSPALAEENFTADFLAHECAHLSWWGGTGVEGSQEQPNGRFISEAFAEYSTILYCHQISQEEGYKCWKKNHDAYFKSRNDYEPMLSSSSSTYVDYLVYNKGSLVLWALKNKLGDEKMRNGMRAFVAKYSFRKDPGFKRPTILDFKAVMEETSGVSLNDFWNLHFNSSKIVSVEFSLRRNTYKDKFIDQAVFKNLSHIGYPAKFRAYHFDGTITDTEFAEKDKTVTYDKMVFGIEFVNLMETIAPPNASQRFFETMTIKSLISWGKPPVIVASGTNPESVDRANRWKELTGGTIAQGNFVKDPYQTIILVGYKPILDHAGDLLDNHPVKLNKDGLLWGENNIIGDFWGVFTLVGKGIVSPIIADFGTGELPNDLSFMGIYATMDESLALKFNSTKLSGITVPLASQMLTFPWGKRENQLFESKLSMPITPKAEYKATYYGFDEKKFEFGKIEKTISAGDKEFAPIIAFDADGKSFLNVKNTDIFLCEDWNFDFTGGKDCLYQGPSGFSIPEFSAPGIIKLNWNEFLAYTYSLDGVLSGKWENSNGLDLSNLSPTEHEIKIVFISPKGFISKVFSGKVTPKTNPPKLIVEKNRALLKKNTITITGFTSSDCILDPPGAVGEDGRFKIVVQFDPTKPVTELTITAKDKFGSATTVKVPVVKYVKFSMKIGSKTAHDEDGNAIQMASPPLVIGRLTYVPMRFVGNQLGATIDYDATSKKITYKLYSTVIELWIGKLTATVNGKEITLPGPPVIVGGSTLVPLRFISEALGAKVEWLGASKTIIVEYPAD